MSKDIKVLEQTTVKVGGVEYLITAFPATAGLVVADKIMGASVDNKIDPKFVKDVITSSVDYKGRRIDDKTFDYHFSRRYNDVQELFAKIMDFNFGELDPNDGSESLENDDISEN